MYLRGGGCMQIFVQPLNKTCNTEHTQSFLFMSMTLLLFDEEFDSSNHRVIPSEFYCIYTPRFYVPVNNNIVISRTVSLPTVLFRSFRTDRSGQTVQTQIRLLMQEQSDQGLHCLGAVWSVSTLFAIPSASFGCITLRKSHFAQLLGWLQHIFGCPKF